MASRGTRRRAVETRDIVPGNLDKADIVALRIGRPVVELHSLVHVGSCRVAHAAELGSGGLRWKGDWIAVTLCVDLGLKRKQSVGFVALISL